MVQQTSFRSIQLLFGLCVTAATLGGGAVAQEAPTTPTLVIVDGGATTTGLAVADRPSSDVLRVLDAIEERHGSLDTLVADFDQLLVDEQFQEETRSQGTVYLDMPERLRCEYGGEVDASTILFIDNTLYQFVPANAQVDKWVYDDPQEARKRLNLLMLGFGLSSEEILKSYEVQLAPGSLDPAVALAAAQEGADETESSSKAGDSGESAEAATDAKTIDLVFRPRDPEIARTYDSIEVGFDPATLLPRRVRLSKVVGEVTTITIDPQKVRLGEPIDAEKFRAEFPGNPEIIEYDE